MKTKYPKEYEDRARSEGYSCYQEMYEISQLSRDDIEKYEKIILKYKKRDAASLLGSVTTPKKAKASRENGKKGGYHKNFKKK